MYVVYMAFPHPQYLRIFCVLEHLKRSVREHTVNDVLLVHKKNGL